LKIVLDTNVVVSGTINAYGAPGLMLQRVLAGDFVLCYDARILAEYEEVLRRKEFNFTQEQVSTFLDVVQRNGHLTIPLPLEKPLPDLSDQPFLEVALGASAEALVTGNLKNFPATPPKGLFILAPAEFLARFSS
jgi:putative PIN family toxin of toxin-antitoxin system